MSNPAFLGILNVQTIAYAGFAILAVFLLVIIVWGIIHLSSGGDLWTIAMSAFSGAIILILAYVIIYNLASTSTIITENASYASFIESEMTPLTQDMINMRYYEQNISLNAEITNLRICSDDTLPCITEGLPENTIYIYWEVIGGVGCCNTFGCDYQAFTAFCGSPFQEYNLYDIALDGEVYQWGDLTEWDYECSYDTPWNYFYYENITPGLHELTIWQKNCMEIVDTVIIDFELVDNGDGTYDIK